MKTIEKPTIWNGKWRLHGTGNFKVWYPRDYKRPKRDRIFFAVLKSQWVNIGFTAEDGESVEKILRDRNLIGRDAAGPADSVKLSDLEQVSLVGERVHVAGSPPWYQPL